MIIGYTTGVFDLFHVGHLNLLKRAKGLCDRLIVAITTDELTLALKNQKPMIPFCERQAIVDSIKYVDVTVAQSEVNELTDYEKYKFSVIFKGSDWQGTEKWRQLELAFTKKNVRVVFFPYTEESSSTLTRKKLSV